MPSTASGCSQAKKKICTELPLCKWVISKGCQVAPTNVAKVEKSKVVDKSDLFPGVLIGAVPQKTDVINALNKANRPNSRSKKNLTNNEPEDKNYMAELYELLDKTGAVPLTLDLAKQYIGTNLVMFSDFDFEMEDVYPTGKLSELAKITINGLDNLKIKSITGKRDTVRWTEDKCGSEEKVMAHPNWWVLASCMNRNRIKGNDSIFVWLKKTPVKSPVAAKSPVAVKSPVTAVKTKSDRSKQKSPPFPAKEHSGVMIGNDGRKYVSPASNFAAAAVIEYGDISSKLLKLISIKDIGTFASGSKVDRDNLGLSDKQKTDLDNMIDLEHSMATKWLKNVKTFGEIQDKMMKYVTGNYIASVTHYGPLNTDHSAEASPLEELIQCGIITTGGQPLDIENEQIAAYLTGEFMCHNVDKNELRKLFNHCNYIMCVNDNKQNIKYHLHNLGSDKLIEDLEDGYAAVGDVGVLTLDDGNPFTTVALSKTTAFNLEKFNIPTVTCIMWGESKDILSPLIEKAKRVRFIYGNRSKLIPK